MSWKNVRRNSIAVRLALMFGAAAIVGFVLLGATLREVLARELILHEREQVQDRLQELSYQLEHARTPGLALRLREKMETLSANGRTHYWLWSDDPEWRFGTDAEAITAAALRGPGVQRLQLPGSDRETALHGVELPPTPIRPRVRLAVGTSSEPFVATLRGFERGLVPVVLVGALGVALLGYGIAWLGLRPLARMSGQAQRIGPSMHGQRLDLPRLPVELADLGQSFNAALDRIEVAYTQLESFNADVAHELRTPLANLIGQTQVALSRERAADHLFEVLHSNLEELERLRAIVADMLFLARAEQGARAVQVRRCSLAAEVRKTAEFYEVLLEEAGMRVEVTGDAEALVEISLFQRAMSNLLQNAIQHSLPGAVVQVHCEVLGELAHVSVSNPAPPIPQQALERLFDRFFRVDSARSNSDANHGLGLAIVKAVARMHGGGVSARSADGCVHVGFSVARAPG